MKRLLSIILALAMTIALIPAVSAEGDLEYITKTILIDDSTVTVEAVTDDTDDKYQQFRFDGESLSVLKFNDEETSGTYFDASSAIYNENSTNLSTKNTYKVDVFPSSAATSTNANKLSEKGLRIRIAKNGDSLVLKTKAPKAEPTTYKITYEYGKRDLEGATDVYVNDSKIGSVNHYDELRTKYYIGNTIESESIAITPDADGNITFKFTQTSNANGGNVLPYKITIQEVETTTTTFTLSEENDSFIEIDDDTSLPEDFEKIKTNSAEGYVKYLDCLYVAESTDIYAGRNFWHDNLNSTSRFRIASLSDNFEEKHLDIKFKLRSGIYEVEAKTYKTEMSGNFAVYADGVFIGKLDDYVSDRDSRDEQTVILDAAKFTADENGYVTLSIYPYDNPGGSDADFFPMEFTFNKAEKTSAVEIDTVNVYVNVYDEGGSVDSQDIVQGEVNSVVAGKEITMTAVPEDGYEFSYWSDSNGNFKSDEKEYSFKAYTNSVVYANFDRADVEEVAGVEFFNGNGDKLALVQKTTEEIFGDYEKPDASLTGYTFSEWSIDDSMIVDSLVRAVALYEKEGNEISDIITVNGIEVTEKKYGDEIVCSAPGAVSWLRNGKVIAYGESFLHYAFGGEAITSSNVAIANKAPVVVLETIGDAYFIEYDDGDYEILEAGILFGTEEKNTIDGCYYKARVKDIKNHGQFTAKKNTKDEKLQTVARGYVVYKNGDGICVKYSD